MWLFDKLVERHTYNVTAFAYICAGGMWTVPSTILDHHGTERLGGFNSRPNLTNSQLVCSENDLHLQHNYHNHTSWLSTNFQIKSSNCSTFESGVPVVLRGYFHGNPLRACEYSGRRHPKTKQGRARNAKDLPEVLFPER